MPDSQSSLEQAICQLPHPGKARWRRHGCVRTL